MNLAAFESSTHVVSVALSCSGHIFDRSARLPNGGSRDLLPWLQELLAEAGITLRQLDAVAFGSGPGGFTGLRLACGLAQGLSVGLDVPIIGISSLEALALQAGSGHIAVAMDARMEEIYWALYRVEDEAIECLAEPRCASPNSVLDLPSIAVQEPPSARIRAPALGQDWIGCGDAFAIYPDLCSASISVRRAELLPRASEVIRLAIPRLARGEGVDAALASPLYVRDKVALTTAERLARGGLR